MCSPSVDKGKPWGYRPHVEVPILMCSPSVDKGKPWGYALMQPSLWRTHSYGNLPYNINIVSLDAIRVL
jgi:hypothetical protein